MRQLLSVLSLLAVVFLSSCEDIVDLNLNQSPAQVVIEAQLSDLSQKQQIRVSRTVPFDSPIASEPIQDARVSVRDNQGLVYFFDHKSDGLYVHDGFVPVAKRTYYLDVLVDEQQYEASSYMPAYTKVDSIGLIEERFFGKDRYFVTFKFYDNAEQDNYYKYDLSINDSSFKFSIATSDKFNNGQYVTHKIRDADVDLKRNDQVSVRRYEVSQSVYAYWNEIQMSNPASAAPANPTSNITNNALGYFSVASGKEYEFTINY